MIFYELFVRSFFDSNDDGIGDLNGITQKLDYLQTLGIDGIWLLPIMKSASFHGYTIIDFYSINPLYGNFDDLKKLIKIAHEKNIKIILDIPINHTSVKCQWFQKAINGDKKYVDYYVWQNEKTDINEKRHWDNSPIWFKYKDKYFYGLFGSSSPDLNFENPELWEEMRGIFKFWLDLGIDGFRLDAAKHIFDYNIEKGKFEYQHEKTIKFWKEMVDYIKSINENSIIVSEIWDSPEVVKKYHGLFDIEFNFPLSYEIKDAVKFQDPHLLVKGIKNTLSHYIKGNVESVSGNFLTNHDMNRLVSELNNDINKVKLAYSILFTLPGYQFIYYGEELGMKGLNLDVNFTEDSQEPFQWYENGFGPGQTEWKGCKYNPPYSNISYESERNDIDSLLNYIKTLIKFRKDNIWLSNARIDNIRNNRYFISYSLIGKNNKFDVYHNFKNQPININIKNTEIQLLNGSFVKNKNIIKLNGHSTIIIKNIKN
ncbi:hypothetical protein XO10_03405 [Marinitoga sp. 1135]|uniref:alpha-amylase family glycosyl hydrolase n=1 Tax=Marinitoga sp. 1135 TaxID=1643333 RepID=UPI00158665AE|nr:alpha-amylase family glycosyl hydrolase [Marinitoga sp. 1135]NUU95321.1 hypothetical protein [Marinitoga sp. 1135]